MRLLQTNARMIHIEMKLKLPKYEIIGRVAAARSDTIATSKLRHEYLKKCIKKTQNPSLSQAQTNTNKHKQTT